MLDDNEKAARRRELAAARQRRHREKQQHPEVRGLYLKPEHVRLVRVYVRELTK